MNMGKAELSVENKQLIVENKLTFRFDSIRFTTYPINEKDNNWN